MLDDLRHHRNEDLGAFQLIEPDVALVLFVAGLLIGMLIS